MKKVSYYRNTDDVACFLREGVRVGPDFQIEDLDIACLDRRLLDYLRDSRRPCFVDY